MSNLTLDSFEVARKKSVLEGALSLEVMPELADAIEGLVEGELAYTIEGLGQVRDLPAARLTISGEVELTCARCNDVVIYPVDVSMVYRFVENEAQADALPLDDDREGEDVVVGSRAFSIADWVQEEVLLGLPALPLHEDCETDAYEPEVAPKKKAPQKVGDQPKAKQGDTQRPFAGLDQLLKH